MLNLINNNLCGTIPSEIGQLTNFTDISLSDNHLTGEIPDAIWSIPSLRTLSLSNNQLTGTLSSAIGNADLLVNLSINMNNLTGSIPNELCELKNIEILELNYNQFSGCIPENIGELTNLKRFHIENNQIEGNIPTSLCQLTKLESFYASENNLCGILPSDIGNLLNLVYFNVDNNSIEGSIPTSLCRLRKLESFLAYGNNLCGVLPSDIGNLLNLVSFNVVYNNIEGGIPEGFADLSNLQDLYLSQNRLSGPISEKLYQCPNWSKWEPSRNIYPQQEGYVLYPENYYISTDFSKDGEVKILQSHAKGNGIKLVLMGDLFVDKDMLDGGLYESAMKETMEAYFSIEPFKSLREYFDVIMIKAVSPNNWPSGETALGLPTTSGYEGDINKCMEYAAKAIENNNLENVQIISIVNLDITFGEGGIFNNGFGYIFCGYDKKSPEKWKDALNHEAGHAFVWLCDEYIGPEEDLTFTDFDGVDINHSMGWYANVDYISDPEKIYWAHLIRDSRYAEEELGAFEGAYWKYGIYRPTVYSIMNKTITVNGEYLSTIIDQFNAPSREAIYKRAMKLAYGNSWNYNYEEFVKFDAQGHIDFVAAKNKAQTRSIASDVKETIKHTPPKIYNYPAVVK